MMSATGTPAASRSAGTATPTLRVSVRLPLDHFDLEVDFSTRAHAVGVFGPSGAGKTSVLRAIAGLEAGARGRISLGDEVWLDSDAGIWVPPERRSIGYLPQDGLLFPNQDVRGNLLAGAARARRGQPRRGAVRHHVPAAGAHGAARSQRGDVVGRRAPAGRPRARHLLGPALAAARRAPRIARPAIAPPGTALSAACARATRDPDAVGVA